jgi:CheY-like chemotaxis protein
MANSAQAILVVDDDPGFRELVAEVLSDEGYHPLTAAPADALDLATREPFALALLDARMPGIDGPSLCRRLRAWPPTRDVPVIFVTGLPRERLLLRLAGCEPWWFLSKPCSLTDLIAAVHRHLGPPRALASEWPSISADQ